MILKSIPIRRFYNLIKKASLIFSFIIISNSPALAKIPFSEGAKYEVCFTPGEDCTSLIVDTLDNAREQILVQAYSFTCAFIAKALSDASNRGVDVKVILDKSQLSARYTMTRYLLNQAIHIWIDSKPAIAHNKVMIIDNHTVLTGSFNFTKSAQSRNAENVIIIEDPELAKRYKAAWEKRQHVSKIFES